jgi:hypothetical protein
VLVQRVSTTPLGTVTMPGVSQGRFIREVPMLTPMVVMRDDGHTVRHRSRPYMRETGGQGIDDGDAVPAEVRDVGAD